MIMATLMERISLETLGLCLSKVTNFEVLSEAWKLMNIRNINGIRPRLCSYDIPFLLIARGKQF